MPEILGFIPARGGSKGIPQKNLFPVMGKPLLQYTLEAAAESRHLTRRMLSSEDWEIRDFAAGHGVDTRYIRPQELATDEATTIDTVLHALDWLEERNELPDIVVLLQPTSPLRTSQHIDAAIEQFRSSGCSSLVSVHPMTEHPWKCLDVSESGWRFLARPAKNITRRQEYSNNYYTINGALYIATPQFIRSTRGFITENETELFFMPPAAGVDIDELPDVFQTEAHLKTALSG